MIYRADDARVACPLFQAEYGGASPTSALQLRLVQIDIRLAIQLTAAWHSRLPAVDFNNIIRTSHRLFFGALCSNTYYAVAIWTDPVARLLNGRGMLELRRLAIAPDAPKNTASRMLAVMTRLIRGALPSIKTLISYQDTEVHTGTIYKAAGWTAVSKSKDGDWNRPNRSRKSAQSNAPKVRWELALTN